MWKRPGSGIVRSGPLQREGKKVGFPEWGLSGRARTGSPERERRARQAPLPCRQRCDLRKLRDGRTGLAAVWVIDGLCVQGGVGREERTRPGG